ncbi:Ser-Thr-rich glycosyl-phosphatidyl-inositol-anchored membrane family protein [compost metagenome]
MIAGGNSTITWVVSGTTASPYNVANVKIDFTSDAGANWTTLAASVPNSGTASVAIPESLVGKTGHIRVSAIGNVFYAVKPATVSATLAVSDLNNSKDVKVYPNPVKDILNVTNITLNSNYEIFNTAGQLVSKGNLGTGKIAVSKLTKGVYFINIDDNGTSVKTKFVKD